jgi:hypothetical protein
MPFFSFTILGVRIWGHVDRVAMIDVDVSIAEGGHGARFWIYKS